MSHISLITLALAGSFIIALGGQIINHAVVDRSPGVYTLVSGSK